MLVNFKNLLNHTRVWLRAILQTAADRAQGHALATPSIKSKKIMAALMMLPLSAMANIDWVVNNDDAGASVPAGSNITYNVTVANNGSDPAPSTTLTLSIDPATTFVSATGLACSGTGPVTCTVPALAAAGNAGDDANVVVVVRTSTLTTPVTLGASVPTAGDSDSGNNVANEPTPVSAGADVRLVITGPATAQSGSTVTYVYTATNLGPSPSTGTVLSIPKPTGLDNITTPAGCTLGGSTYTCNIAALAVTGTGVINFVGQISAASPSTVSLQGSTAASGATPDPIAANNAATFDTTVTPGSDLRILKSSTPSGGTQLTGTAVTFTLTPSYTGDVPGAMTITDTIPANYTIGTVASPQNGWTCGVAGQVVTCSKPTGTVAGVNVPLGAVSIPTTAASAGAGIINSATITGPVGQDPNAANNTASSPAMTLVDPIVDLRANKTGPSNPALVVVGNPYNFDISMTNIGTAAFFGTARMVDHLPAGLTVTSYTLNGWTCSPAAPVVGGPGVDITCERIYTSGTPLAVGATTPVVTLNTTATGTGDIDNGLTVSSPNPNIADLNPGNDNITYRVNGANPAASADIAVIKTIAHPLPSTSASGEEVWYKVEVINFGSVTSNNVTLTDALQNLINSSAGSTGAGFISAVITPGLSTGGSCSSVANGATRRDLTCTFTSIPVCSNGVNCPTVEVRVRPGGNADPARANTASAISSTTHDPDLTNNADTITSVITAKVDVTVTKTAPASVPAGQNLTYIITAQNVANGMSSADNVEITDTLPANLLFISATPSTGSCATKPAANSTTGAGNNQVVCNLGTIANGGQQTVTIVVRPKTALTSTNITNGVDVTTTTPELTTVEGGLINHADAVTAVGVPVVNLFIDKVDDVDPVAVGDNLVYTVQVTNSGLSAAENVTITDTLPTTKLNYISHTVPTGGSCSKVGNILTCSVPYLAPGAVTNFTVTMQGTAKGVDNNVATVTSNEIIAGNGTADNSGGGETTTVRSKADMEVVSKTPSAATVNLNEPFTYVVKVRNNGPDEADDVVVSDTLPAGMVLSRAPLASDITVVSGTTIPAVPAVCTGTAGGNTISCTLGTANNTTVVDITIPVRVTSVGGTFNNTASVLTSSRDTNGGSNPAAGNNFKTVPVTVNKSSLAGEVYRDVNDDGIKSGAAETGILGVQMRLTGTDIYGNAITRTVTTGAGGAYLFDNLPQSNAAGYTVIEILQPVGFTDGIEAAGTSGGTPGADHTTDIISGIVLAANTAATGYLFGEIPPVTVSGTVFNDANGLSDTFVNGTGTNAASATLTAYLVQGGLVVASSPVAANGTFSFGAAQGTGYTVVLSNTAGVAVGAGAPAASLPTGWVNVGENNELPTVAGSDGTINGVSAPFTVALVDVPNRNFGIEQPPTSGTAIYTGQPNPLGTTTVPVGAGAFTGALPPGVSGTNATDTAAVTNIRITAFPTNVTSITINGITYTSATFPVGGVTVTVAQLAGMAVDPIDGAVTVDIPYVAIDAAGRESPVGHVQLPFGQITLSGNVFNDVNGSKVKDGAEAPLQLGLNAVLTDVSGTVIAVTPILADGTYLFNVAPNATYGVTVTTANPAIGATSVPVTLPAGGWVTTGESLATVAEATPDSRQTVSVLLAPVTNVNFGLAQATAAVSGNVWRDADHNRAFGTGETAVQGITVELLNAAGTAVVKTTVTDASGHYLINNLAPGDYTVRFRDNATGGIILGSPTYDDQVANTLPGAGTGATPIGSSNIDTIGQTLKVSLIANQELVKQSLPFDPSGVVYNSVTREPVAGATVTLFSGGVAVPPSCLIGNQNAQVTGPLGTYQYLLIRPVPGGCPGSGAYTIQVQQPSGFLPPNAVQGGVSLPGGTYTPPAGVGVEPIQPQSTPPAVTVTGVATIYYFNFNFDLVGGRGVVNNHIPLDPVLSNSFIVTKTGNKTIAEIGDVVTYTVKAKMTQGLRLTTFDLVDNLPAGFRYIPGTATQSTGGAAQAPLADPLPAGNLGPQLTFKPAFAVPGGVTDATITYKVRVGVGAMQGDGINRVQGRSPFATSNTAQYKVKVTGGVFTNDACLAGKVFVDCNNNHVQDAEELGIPGVRLYMEDGTYFISDVEGKYSYCGISPKTHVLKVDSLTMPRGSRLTITSNRNAGDGNSLFLDTKNGELIRADFAEGSCSNTVLEQVKARRTGGEVRAPETEKKGGPAIKFEGKSPAYPQQGTDSANQRLVKPRGGAGDAPVSNTVIDNPVQPLPESSGNTRGNNLRDQKGGAK